MSSPPSLRRAAGIGALLVVPTGLLQLLVDPRLVALAGGPGSTADLVVAIATALGEEGARVLALLFLLRGGPDARVRRRVGLCLGAGFGVLEALLSPGTLIRLAVAAPSHAMDGLLIAHFLGSGWVRAGTGFLVVVACHAAWDLGSLRVMAGEETAAILVIGVLALQWCLVQGTSRGLPDSPPPLPRPLQLLRDVTGGLLLAGAALAMAGSLQEADPGARRLGRLGAAAFAAVGIALLATRRDTTFGPPGS